MLNDFLKNSAAKKTASRDSLIELLESGVLDISREEQRMLLNVLEVHDTIAREIMVPRMDMISISEDKSYRDLMEVVQKYGHSRLPLLGKDVDTVIGILYAKDFLNFSMKGATSKKLVDMAREPFFVPETKPVFDLLKDFQSRHIHQAIVVDEYGGVSGLVCLEDILEMFVGDIQDEYDNEQEVIVKVRKFYYRIDGRTSVQQVNDVCGTDFSLDTADTIGGLVMKLSGSIPKRHEVVSSDGCRIKVLSVDGNRVQRVQLHCPESRSAGA